VSIKTINFVREGAEPKPFRATRVNLEVEKVKQALLTWPPGQSMIIETTETVEKDGTKKNTAYQLSRKLAKALDPKKYNIYRAGAQVVVQHVNAQAKALQTKK